MTILPAEILDHIFSSLRKDPATLRSIHEVCSETHNSFLLGVLERHLYAHIVVTNFTSSRPGFFHCSKLLQYLSSNPHVSKYIRTLQIEIEMPGPSQWYDAVSPILWMLPSTLKGITLSSRTRSKAKAEKAPTMLQWSALHETFREAFLDCLRSSNLTDASIHCVEGVPLLIFDDCTMQKLSLRRVGFTMYSTSVVQFPPQTVSLIIDRCNDLSEIIDWAQGGPNLRSLSFSSDSQYLFAHFLTELCGESLTDLGLDFGTLFRLSYPPPCVKLKRVYPPFLNISRLPNLTNLTICTSILCNSKELWIESPIPSIAQVAATSSSLKRLILRIEIDPWSVDGIADSKIWRPLMSLADRSSLEHIELGLMSVSSKRRGISDVISALLGVSELKKMYEENFLSVKEVDK